MAPHPPATRLCFALVAVLATEALAACAGSVATIETPGSQNPTRTRNSAEVVAQLPTFAAAASSDRQIELVVRWTIGSAPAGTVYRADTLPDVNRFDIRRRVPVTDAPVVERDPQVGPDDLVIVAVDAQGREVAWQRVKDPRLIRSEATGASGTLTGQLLYRSETELIVRVPEAVNAAELTVYQPQPQRSGGQSVLRALGTIASVR